MILNIKLTKVIISNVILLFMFVGAFAQDVNLDNQDNNKKKVSFNKSNDSSELAKIAKEMKPGTWAEVPCEKPKGLMNVFTGKRPSGKDAYYHIAGWTDDGHWNPKTGQFFYMGYRKQLKFITYSEKENKWSVLPGPFGWNTPGEGAFEDTRESHYGHVYGRNALDVEKEVFYHTIAGFTYMYDIKNSKWTRVSGGSHMSIEFFPGVGILAHNNAKNKGDKNVLRRYDVASESWVNFAEIPFTDHHAMARYNPLLGEMLLIAGNDHETVVKVDKSGKVTQLKDVPFDITIRHGKLVVDYASGLYLIFANNELHQFDSRKNEYKKIEGFEAPWVKSEMPVPAAIPEHGVTMFIDRKLMIYKHNAPAFEK